MKKYPSILQQNEEDCGAACLGTIVKYYNKTFNINRIRERIGMYLVAPNSVLRTMENGRLLMFEMLGPLRSKVNYCKDAMSLLTSFFLWFIFLN